jgi:protein TonB
MAQSGTGDAGSGAGAQGAGPGSAVVGSGNAAGRGSGGPGNGSGRGDEYLAQLRRHILEYHHYPKGAKANGIATVSIDIAADGTVGGVTLEHSSGDPTIDRDAVDLPYRASPVPPPPPEKLHAGHVRISIPVEYRPGFFERIFQ